MDTRNLSLALHELQANVIGLFKPYRFGDYEMVVKNDDGMLTTISIGKLGGLHETHIGADQGQLIVFDNGETLADVMKDPFRLQEFIDRFKINNIQTTQSIH